MKISTDIEDKVIDLYLRRLPLKIIKEECSIGMSSIHCILKRRGIELRPIGSHKRTVFFDCDIFEKIDSDEKAYWLGFIAADGYITRHSLALALAKKDADMVERFADFCGCSRQKIFEIRYELKNKVYYSSKIQLNSIKLVKDLESLNITRRKSLTLKPPLINDGLFPSFIRGYFDGDGSVAKNKNRIDIAGSKYMVDWLHWFFTSRNLTCSVYKHTTANVYYFSTYGVENLRSFKEIIYCGDIFMKRKRDLLESKNQLSIKELQKIERDKVKHLKDAGFSYLEIFEKTGLSYNRIHYLIKQINLLKNAISFCE